MLMMCRARISAFGLWSVYAFRLFEEDWHASTCDSVRLALIYVRKSLTRRGVRAPLARWKRGAEIRVKCCDSTVSVVAGKTAT
jgi:hypothetical protein